MNFISTWKNLLKHCIFANLLLMEFYLQDALQKELLIVPFVECLKAALWERLTERFRQYLE